ncbi:isocitrate lyase/phosphoenolpyruvate mutase family protein [Actinobacteria bacterium YIM 96077]|uniref:Isocitrate lyase/phosphoenolpyruvate mutase family protein n=1 Tax=Phytoactinopolyspora halophila TaxID=1981511 RepID=A0A329QLI7_9ACTN|nr:isocitrate lyase/phosphoenolpyruvate mutase family protein [Phytoactinopolyspora halophila]AYY14839.1 isocitrate lyase/phosphoenolpyruvate mutase family protein [Actinobacteria bacterium YIM 96077]RAW13113.1 isocitrate lyase/phosphoenolpyruvate mutase family protein [Phytoactinopolyspora halophila]
MSTTDAFRALHDDGLFVLPNAWDIGSARLLEHLGFSAVATTSSGYAGSLGRLDQNVGRHELLTHVESLTAAISIPVSVDTELCYPDEPGGITGTVELLAEAGAAGCSIEDYDPATGILPLEVATERVTEAADVAARRGLVLTARAENHLYGVDDLDDTIERLTTYRDAGAEVVYAPGLVKTDDIQRVVRDVGGAVNVLTLPGVPSTAELASLGVRRVSTGSSLAWTAYGALVSAGRELLNEGTMSYLDTMLASQERDAAFVDRQPASE